MECGGDRETLYRAEFMWLSQYRHHNLGGFVCTHSVVHKFARGEVHQVVIGEEDGHVIGGDAQAGGVGIGVGHADKQAKLRLDKFIKLIVRQHIITKYGHRGKSKCTSADKQKGKPCKPLVGLASNLALIGMRLQLEAIHGTKDIWNTESGHGWCGAEERESEKG